MKTLQEKLSQIKEILFANPSAEQIDQAAEIAHTLIVCGYADQGGGYRGRKIVEQRWSALTTRIKMYFEDQQALVFFESMDEAKKWVNEQPIRFTPYTGNGLDGGTN